jgi:uncharacterized protein YbbC (DUF1343 family)
MSLIFQNLADMQEKVVPGIDTFLEHPITDKNIRWGLLTNDAAFSSDGLLSRVALVKKGFNLVKLFSPEHGITRTGADGTFQNNSIDSHTGLPVISLYGDRLSPTEEDLSDIDRLIVDIPDVGCRFYTYLWTVTYVMEACAMYGKQLIVLDRPNPLGGEMSMAEGPMLDEINCPSFIGRWSIPIRHSCTLGELANYFSAKKIEGFDLKIIPVRNWQRYQLAGTDLFSFVPTSPAIKNSTTALLYPGMGLLEGINVNEGRGTDIPFQVCGAPWINADHLQELFKSKNLAVIKSNPHDYTPADGLYKGEHCYGLQFSITNALNFHPVRAGLSLLQSIIELYPLFVKERLYITNANPTGRAHLDKLTGIQNSFDLFISGSIFQTDVSKTWPKEITPYLLYD